MERDSESRVAEAGTNWRSTLLEITLIFFVFCVYAATPTPGVNEAHYLAKAKHYWNPQWCPHDHFLNSADAHAVFYWTWGWLTRWLSFPAVAWLGRITTWWLLAWSWRRLSFAVCPVRGLAILSAGLFVVGLQWGHMAGEWVLGGFEAKGFAYVLVFLALEAMLLNRWSRALLLLGAATSFHVLVGGWSLVAATIAWMSCGSFRPAWKELVIPACGAVLLALPGLWPALTLTIGTDAATIREGNEIHVYGRLGHHLLFHRFLYDPHLPFVLVLRHVGLFFAWMALGISTPCEMASGKLGQRPLRGFVGGAFAIATCGMLLDQVLIQHVQLTAAVMKYYWFRLSDAMVPAGAALAFVAAISRWPDLRPQLSRWLLRGALIVVAWQMLGSATRHFVEFQRGGTDLVMPLQDESNPLAAKRLADWKVACEWIRRHTEPDAVFLTPRWQQTFKWHAERAEVATWKDVPQDPKSVVEWWHRIGAVYTPDVSVHGLSAHSDEALIDLAKRYGVRYLVLDRFQSQRTPGFPRVYPPDDEDQTSFAVYRIETEGGP